MSKSQIATRKSQIKLKRAVEFHGHLGPYLVLGLLAGEWALKKLKAKKHFGLKVKVWGANQRPRSCLIDGLQLSTGATYGKGNIQKIKGRKIQIAVLNLKNNKKIKLSLNEGLIERLAILKGHKDSEFLAKKIFVSTPKELFDF